MTAFEIDTRLRDSRRFRPVGIALLAALAGLLLLVATVRSATLPDQERLDVDLLNRAALTADARILSANYPNCRFGVGEPVSGYTVTPLNIGWHMDWSTQLTPSRPNGAEYVQVIRLAPDLDSGYRFTPVTQTLYTIIDQNRGATWLIGNEPDSPWQDNLAPETYAQAYHHVYTLIKQRDPSARIGAGGIVQPTPLRFQYLDRVLNTYRQLYDEPLPADLWNTHSYILREIDASDPQAQPKGPYEVWGAFIPPGMTATRGVLYEKSQMFSLGIFRQRLIDFRTWLRDRGYRDTPVYVTEYGELFPYPPDTPGGGFHYDEMGMPITEARVAAFMTGTFNVLLNLTDPNIGYAADNNRLVQRWLWYSVSDTELGGALFDPGTHQRRQLGNVFAAYTSALSPTVDLLAVRVLAEPAAINYTGKLVATTLKATVSNIGNVSTTGWITIAFYAGYPPTGTLIGSPRVIKSGLGGCAGTVEVTRTWSNLGAGAHPMYVVVDPGHTIDEANDDNNSATGFALVATRRVFLPIATRDD
ncbi:MAG TPA: CARDB domain-containing protein [Anaerolineae bacterium]|nr:CARDB domain-containing protein [Anaerolineae bacterium]